MRQAEFYGYRPEDSNPCKGIKRYGRAGRDRFLSADEIGRLAAALARHGAAKPLHVAAITLLLLTGCRKSEILTLKWTDYRDGKLFLADGKTGPRTVWLSASARELLAELAREGKQVFYSHGATVDQKSLGRFWRRTILQEADPDDVRLERSAPSENRQQLALSRMQSTLFFDRTAYTGRSRRVLQAIRD